MKLRPFVNSLALAALLPALPLFAQSSPTDSSAASAPLPAAEDVVEDVVETVKLGGEDRQPAQQEGVGQADAYQETADPDSPVHVEVGEGGHAPIPAPVTPVVDGEAVEDPSVHDPSRVAYPVNRRNARNIALEVPGPRGMITDRNGLVMACSEVAYQPALNFGQLQDESDAAILTIAHETMEAYRALGVRLYDKSDAQLLDHYRYRRWLSLPLGPTMREKEVSKLREKLQKVPHGQLVPLYIRNYPARTTACHILGYTGVAAKLPTGPINHNDPIFERQEGRSGLELKFNKQLTGRPGQWRLMFDEQGKRILDELKTKPRPGGTVVTTLNLEWQKAAEKALRDNTKGRGAFVLVDVHTGEILVMASVPNFDPNDFIPSISQKDYDVLRNDPNTPLVSRAFAGVYPPASTFKTITVAAALRHGVIQEDTYVNCPYSITIGGHKFKNHSGFEGSINCITALVLSNNPFMYQVAATLEPRIGADRLCQMARRFGYGSTTGIPLPDKAGNVPDEAWMQRNYGRGFMAGDAANMSIGQGPLLATPLQVAHAISGIANGSYMPRLQLIRQILDSDGNVVYQFNPAVQTKLTDMSAALASVRKGMRAVVNRGTGHRAKLSYVDNAGKTGTAQWGRPSDDCRLAWFAGFLPADSPRYAYVALYEGSPHEHISGGRMAANIVRVFFESIKTSMKASLEEPERRFSLPPGIEDEDAAEEVEPEESAAAAAQRAAEEAAALRRQQEAQRRNQQSGWDDGRARH